MSLIVAKRSYPSYAKCIFAQPFGTSSKRNKSISLFAFLRKNGKFVCMDNACIMALDFIRPQLISVNVAPK